MEQPVKENQGSQVPKSVATHDTVTQPEHRDLATAIREVRAAQENERKGDNIVADSSNAESRNAAPSVTKPESVDIPDHSVEMEEDVAAEAMVSPSEVSETEGQEVPVWEGRGGGLLNEVIAAWTLDAGFRLIIRDRWSWKLDYDYRYTGDLKEAISDLLSGYAHTSPTPIVTFYTNRVVVISTR